MPIKYVTVMYVMQLARNLNLAYSSLCISEHHVRYSHVRDEVSPKTKLGILLALYLNTMYVTVMYVTQLARKLKLAYF